MKLVTLIAALSLTATFAHAQSVSGASLTAASKGLEGGYGGARALVSGTINPSTRDANNNRIVQNGLIQTGQGGSEYFPNSTFGGAANSQSGVGSITNYAVGNLINVQVSGSWNTVVLNSTQINNGAVTATTTVNGKRQTSGGQLN